MAWVLPAIPCVVVQAGGGCPCPSAQTPPLTACSLLGPLAAPVKEGPCCPPLLLLFGFIPLPLPHQETFWVSVWWQDACLPCHLHLPSTILLLLLAGVALPRENDVLILVCDPELLQPPQSIRSRAQALSLFTLQVLLAQGGTQISLGMPTWPKTQPMTFLLVNQKRKNPTRPKSMQKNLTPHRLGPGCFLKKPFYQTI